MSRQVFVVRSGKVVPKYVDERVEGTDVHVKASITFKSRQLPRNCPNHKGEFSAEGMPVFTTKYQANETARRISGEEDTICHYEGM